MLYQLLEWRFWESCCKWASKTVGYFHFCHFRPLPNGSVSPKSFRENSYRARTDPHRVLTYVTASWSRVRARRSARYAASGKEKGAGQCPCVLKACICDLGTSCSTIVSLKVCLTVSSDLVVFSNICPYVSVSALLELRLWRFPTGRQWLFW